MKIISPSNFFKKIKNFHLLLDSSFFIDSSIHKKEFLNLVKKLKKNDNPLVTIDLVKAELTIGAQNRSHWESKSNLIKRTVDYLLPITQDVLSEKMHELIKIYGPKGKGISSVDLILCAVLQKYDNLLLVTKNPKDFPKPLTNLKTYFLMDLDKGLQTYAFLEKNN